MINRKEGNDQKLVQLLNTLHPRHQSERRTHLKQQHHNQNTTSRKPKEVSFQTSVSVKSVFLEKIINLPSAQGVTNGAYFVVCIVPKIFGYLCFKVWL